MSGTRIETREVPWADFGIQYDDAGAPLEELLVAMFAARYGEGAPDALLDLDEDAEEEGACFD